MTQRIILSIASAFFVLLAGSQQSFRSLSSTNAPATLEASELGGECLGEMIYATARVETVDDGWPGPDSLGGDIAPVRSIIDPFPTFDGIAVDPENNKAVMSDENRHSLLIYDRTSGNFSDDLTQPTRHIIGPETRMGFVAGVALDPVSREAYTLNNDGGDMMMVFPYDAHGNVKPTRTLYLPHQSWGISLSRQRNEIAVSVQQLHGVVVYRREAKGVEAPLRVIRGTRTGLNDPHGIYLDGSNNEIVVANHGNWTELRRYTAYDPLVSGPEASVGGHFYPPSITVHAADAKGDAKPLRTIQGSQTKLNWPMGISVDTVNNEIAVANYGRNSVLIFRRTDSGDVAPVRVIQGAETGLMGPVGVAIDSTNGELWVANYGDHTAAVFARTANGNVSPKRLVRNAPAKTPTCGFTNASAAAYDPGRQQILVPN